MAWNLVNAYRATCPQDCFQRLPVQIYNPLVHLAGLRGMTGGHLGEALPSI